MRRSSKECKAFTCKEKNPLFVLLDQTAKHDEELERFKLQMQI